MNVQLLTGGVYLDLYENDPITLNISSEALENTDTKSAYSRQFRVPNSQTNSQFFETAFFVNGYDFDVTAKQDAVILIDGDEYKRGFIRLIKIYVNEPLESVDYEIVFYGETATLSASIGAGFLSDLQFPEYNHLSSYTNVTNSWQAYPEGNIDDGLFDGDVVYPLVNFGNTYDDDGVVQETRIAVGSGIHFTQNSHPLLPERFKPMIRAKAVWDKIFETAGFTYQSSFLNSNIFKQIYATAWYDDGVNVKVYSGNMVNVTTDTINVAANATETIPFDNITLNKQGVWDEANDYFFPNNAFNYTISVSINGEITQALGPSANVVLSLIRDDNGTETTLSSNSWAGTGTPIAWNVTLSNTSDADAKYFVRIVTTDSLTTIDADSFFKVTPPSDFVIIEDLMQDDYKQVDFIKDIIKKFRLCVVPDKSISNKFVIEPWKDYVGTGEIFDWSQKIDDSKDFIIEPTIYTQKQKIEFMDMGDGDFLNKLNEDLYNEVYGTLLFDSGIDIIRDTRKVETKFGATPVKAVEGSSTANNGMLNMIMPAPHVHEVETFGDDNAKLLHRPMVVETRLLFYNGLQDSGYNTANNGTWYFSNGTTQSFTTFPMCSPFSEWPITSNTIDLSWQREGGFFDQPALVGYSADVGKSVYDEYWFDYVQAIYSKWGRRIEANFLLTDQDVRELDLSDMVMVKGNYYYVESIDGVAVGGESLAKVKLIKIENPYIPPVTQFNIWNLFGEQWNLTADTWND